MVSDEDLDTGQHTVPTHTTGGTRLAEGTGGGKIQHNLKGEKQRVNHNKTLLPAPPSHTWLR